MDTYWNHNVAYHEKLVADAKIRGGRVLDVGCGEGLLLQRLRPFAAHLVGIDPDENAIRRAKRRFADSQNVTIIHDDFLTLPIPCQDDRFDTITCVATLHHMELRAALSKMRQCLAPGGRLLVVGLSANKSILDFIISGLSVLPIRFMDKLHGGAQEIGVRLAEPKESLKEIRQVANEVLPGVKIKRLFYYRYLLMWDMPNKDSDKV